MKTCREDIQPMGRVPAWIGLMSYAAAALIATGGYLHYCLYRKGYRFIPKIGASLLFQVGASAVVAAALVVRPKVGSFARLAGAGLSLGTLGAFWLTRTGNGLFGFQERGFNPAPQALLALVTESAAAALLIALVVVGHRRCSFRGARPGQSVTRRPISH